MTDNDSTKGYNKAPTEESDQSQDQSTMTSQTRVRWASKREYLLMCVSYAVGLGNIWRFPYLCYKNGGGAFLVPYLLTLALVAIPVMTLEMIMGQYVGLGAIPVWKLCPAFKGMGYSMTFIMGNVCLFYMVLIVYALYYFTSVFTSSLPWASCDNEWNTQQCLENAGSMNRFLSNVTGELSMNSSLESRYYHPPYTSIESNSTYNITSNVTYVSPSQEFFLNKMLNISSGVHEMGPVQWRLAVCLLVCWLITYFTTFKSIRTSGKVAYITAIFPYLMLLVLVIRGALLPGSLDGIKFYILPKWHHLLRIDVWASGAIQTFYSLGPGLGLYITMASYNNYRNNCFKDAVLIGCVNCGTSIFGGFAVFSVLGAMAYEMGVDIDKVVQAGSGLAFVTYPRALLALPIPQLWSAMFFIMLIVLGMGSEIAHFETILTAISDEWSWCRQTTRRAVLSAIITVFGFLVGLIFITRGGMYYFTLADWYSAQFGLIILSFTECIVFCYVIGLDKLSDKLKEMTGFRPNIYFRACWMVISPVILVLLFAASIYQWSPPTVGEYSFPFIANAMGWCLVACTVLPIPLYFMYSLIVSQKGNIVERMKMITSMSDAFTDHLKERASLEIPETNVELEKLKV